MAGISKVKGSGLATGAATESLVGIDDNATSTAITISSSQDVSVSGGVSVVGDAITTAIDGGTLDYAASVTRLTAGRAGGNYGQLETYVAGASGITKRHQIDYDSTFRWYDADGTSERMRITAAGNVLVGTTNSGLSSSSSATGINLKPNSDTTLARNGGAALYLNRIGTDGAITQFRKNGTTIGAIGTYAGDLTIGDDDIAIRFDTGSGLIPWNLGANSTGGAARSNSIDIGAPSATWKNLYLGGGVYLGGTGATNKLDDYEEGTWTPVLVGATAPVYASTTAGTYTKTGNTVTLSGVLTLTSMTQNNGQVRIGGFPFIVDNSTNAGYTPAVVFPETAISYLNDGVVGLGMVNTTYMAVYSPRSTTGTSTANTTYAHIGDNARFRISITFRVK